MFKFFYLTFTNIQLGVDFLPKNYWHGDFRLVDELFCFHIIISYHHCSICMYEYLSVCLYLMSSLIRGKTCTNIVVNTEIDTVKNTKNLLFYLLFLGQLYRVVVFGLFLIAYPLSVAWLLSMTSLPTTDSIKVFKVKLPGANSCGCTRTFVLQMFLRKWSSTPTSVNSFLISPWCQSPGYTPYLITSHQKVLTSLLLYYL